MNTSLEITVEIYFYSLSPRRQIEGFVAKSVSAFSFVLTSFLGDHTSKQQIDLVACLNYISLSLYNNFFIL